MNVLFAAFHACALIVAAIAAGYAAALLVKFTEWLIGKWE